MSQITKILLSLLLKRPTIYEKLCRAQRKNQVDVDAEVFPFL
ncbi:hypothetical protein M595_5345 [Lyngbya aestuarii BL J]|uniref:Uncharacterized protein n=1 Tax=Lyngbya aestuarii BL J TaxID=1348334 RepID=U7QA29_9CYAN|nr:hypothetical protein M595_5345 [Lyngbya aestuarii BL J]